MVEWADMSLTHGFGVEYRDVQVIEVDEASFDVGIGHANPSARLHVHGRVKDKTGWLLPVGTVVAYGGATEPEGWLMCDGRSIEGDAYEDLRIALGEKTNLPDLRGRFVAGAFDEDGHRPFEGGGLEFVELTEAQMPRHSHNTRLTPTWIHLTTMSTKVITARSTRMSVL